MRHEQSIDRGDVAGNVNSQALPGVMSYKEITLTWKRDGSGLSVNSGAVDESCSGVVPETTQEAAAMQHALARIQRVSRVNVSAADKGIAITPEAAIPLAVTYGVYVGAHRNLDALKRHSTHDQLYLPKPQRKPQRP